jgi:hypothetical protein
MPPSRPYDDDAELTRYVLNHFEQFTTDFEHKVRRSIHVRGNERLSRHPEVRERFSLDDPAVNAALEGGVTAFLRGVRDRILREHVDAVFVHRCERCRSILASPTARQCLWCGHDWH